MAGRLEGRIALVTGASRGIGRAVAEALAGDGAAFIGVHYSSNVAAARQVVEALEDLGTQAALIQADLAHDVVANVKRAVDQFRTEVTARFGQPRIDILVNNAGIDAHRSLTETDEKTFDEVVSVNLKAPFFLIGELLPLFARGGRIINLSTAYTRLAAPTHAAYAAAKGGLSTLTLALAAEFGQHGVTVNAVAPALIVTDINAAWLNTPGAREMVAAGSVFGRTGKTDDVADVIRFLASDESRWITGQTIEVSGGTRI
ncbi:MAG: family oxidoreductase [Bradyrhizobium sp.]|nr:family oxidoreductase [Bradyrhizobium sp.]